MRLLLPEVRDLVADDLPDLYDAPAPWLRGGFVVTLDGAIAVDGRSEGLSSPADKAVFRALRTVADAVIVGAGTARSEDYGPVMHRDTAAAWRAAHDRTPDTPLVVVSRRGHIDPAARFLAGPTVLVVPESATVPDLPVDVLRAGSDEVDLASALGQLRERGLGRLLCEGGPSLLTDLMAGRHVDELCLTHAPLAVGDGPLLLPRALPGPAELELTQLVYDEPGVLLALWRVVRS